MYVTLNTVFWRFREIFGLLVYPNNIFHICHPGVFLLTHIISFIISNTHHTEYNANQNTGATCFDRLCSSSGPIFELFQVLFKIYICIYIIAHKTNCKRMGSQSARYIF